ncbi:MAG: tetratricopeptide repeat protein [Acidobacteriaceae bacterium]|nr:tetratricopeptide repeat protein [Acidobacteriaceae bacterium]
MTVSAQVRGSRGSGTTPGTNTTIPSGNNNGTSSEVTAFLSGKVSLDDGGRLTDPAAIQMTCHGQRHTAAYTDLHGSFSFQFGDTSSIGVGDSSDASSTMMTRSDSLRDERNWRDCEVQAVLAGYSSPVIELASRLSKLESVDLGTITLHRLEHVEGTSISVTSMLAPKPAKKALEKARDEEKKGKWEQAQKSLEKAVEIYPKYAVAWTELGMVQIRQNDSASAKKSFEQSIAADPKYVNAYDGLAQLAFHANQWAQVVEVTDKLLGLNPVNFPVAYFLSGAANYQLGNFDAAEKNTRQGIRVDDAHQAPKLQYLLGMILARKGQYQEASEHIQQYLSVARDPTEIEEGKKFLAEIERASAKPNSAAVQEKK